MRNLAKAAVLVLSLSSAACFHTVVETGRPAGTATIQRPWTATYLWGLVPAAEINTASQCPGGVARVETQQTFVNGLVAGLTLGIYSPRAVTITCASATGSLLPTDRVHQLAEGATQADRAAAIEAAVAESREGGVRVFVQF